MRIFSDLEDRAAVQIAGGVDDVRAEIRANLASVRAVAAIASARGGAGKSSLAINLASALALKGRKVAILDADLNSPSIVSMLGIRATHQLIGAETLEPAAGPLGLRIASSSMFGDGEPPPIAFVDDEPAAAPANGAAPAVVDYARTLHRMLAHTRMGALDLLLIDLAPGLGHLHRLARVVALNGLILVSQPSESATRAAERLLRAAAALKLPVWALIENMVGFNCDSCHSVRPMLPQGALSAIARDNGLEIAARLPFDPRLAESCDRGLPFVRDNPETPLAKGLLELAGRIDEKASLAALPVTDLPR